jgi:predicted DNA-binding transcriptional regulator AlpA
MNLFLNDDERLLGTKAARQFLNNMSRSAFYRNIKRNIIPKPRYMGRTPVWKLGDLRSI